MKIQLKKQQKYYKFYPYRLFAMHGYSSNYYSFNSHTIQYYKVNINIVASNYDHFIIFQIQFFYKAIQLKLFSPMTYLLNSL